MSLWAAPVQAAIVLIARPPAPSAVATEVLSRLRGELLSVGLTVEVVPRPALRPSDGASPRAWLERVATERQVDGALDIVDSATSTAVDVWTFSREPLRSEVTRVVADPDVESSLERMAIRAVEVLRSILIEGRASEDERHESSSPPRPTPATMARQGEGPPHREAPSPERLDVVPWGLEVGAALIVPSFDAVAPAISPLVRLNGAIAWPVALQIEAAGFGSRPEVGNSSGSARIAQQYAVAGLCLCGPAPRRLRPTFALSAGVLHTSVDGRADVPAQGHAVAQWSFLLQASLGARLRAFSRYEVALAVHAQIAEPYVAIYVVDNAVATLGRPTLGLTVTVGGWR